MRAHGINCMRHTLHAKLAPHGDLKHFLYGLCPSGGLSGLYDLVPHGDPVLQELGVLVEPPAGPGYQVLVAGSPVVEPLAGPEPQVHVTGKEAERALPRAEYK